MNEKIVLIGTSQMAIDYANVLKAQKIEFAVVGRGQKSADEFQKKTGIPIASRDLQTWLRENRNIKTAINAVGVEMLASVTQQLIHSGFCRILVEKPAALNLEDMIQLQAMANQSGVKIFVGYNRRFYASVLHVEKCIAEDGGLLSTFFEFTEWEHIISKLEKAPGIKENWFYVNSTHILDTVFFLAGSPETLCTYTAGILAWHPTAGIFTGAGQTKKGILFSYHSNWMSAGRWAIELLTNQNRYLLKPLEKLQVMRKGSVAIENVEIDDSLDIEFKPGLFRQVDAFLRSDERLCTLINHIEMMEYYNKINNKK